jgi:hypothetical protein
MQSTTSTQDLTIRMLNEGDAPALSRLAQRDSAAVPAGELLGAELDGALIAAISVKHPEGRAMADPFVSTEQAVTLLGLRARQLRDAAHSARGWRRPRRPRIARARGAIAGSPPGGGSRLLQL